MNKTFFDFISNEDNSWAVCKLFRKAHEIIASEHGDDFPGMKQGDVLKLVIRKMIEIYKPFTMLEFLLENPSLISSTLLIASNEIPMEKINNTRSSFVDEFVGKWEELFSIGTPLKKAISKGKREVLAEDSSKESKKRTVPNPADLRSVVASGPIKYSARAKE
jgi:hypothetical protein